MNNPADRDHVQDVIERPLTSDENRVVLAWLDIAWRELNRVVPGIPSRNALVATDPQHLATDDVRDVVVAMVERKVRNPDGNRQWSGDDYAVTVDAALSTGQIYVTDAERAKLQPKVLGYDVGIFSIPLGY